MKLNELFPDFEERAGQEAMREAISQAYEDSQTVLIEAGTGIGKTFAYLLPAIMWAYKYDQRTVISTHTIALQQQLVEKDIPRLLEQLDISMNVVLLKGMRHFHCEKKAQEKLDDQGADHESCTHAHCPFYQTCSYFKQKRAAERAEIIVVNHHLLLADLALRHVTKGEYNVLPAYDHVIVDEAHHLEEVATTHFAKTINRTAFFKLVSRMTKEGLVNGQVEDLSLEVPIKRRELFDAIDTFFRSLPQGKVRLTEDKRSVWQEQLDTSFISERGARLRDLIDEFEVPESEERMMGLLITQYEEQIDSLIHWIDSPIESHEARWVEDESVVTASLDVAPFLRETLFQCKATVVLCSATLTAQKSFTYLRQSLGIDEAEEHIFESPFNYEKQVVLALPNDLSPPNGNDFEQHVCKWIEDVVRCCKGNAFALFTSYQMMKACQSALHKKFKKQGYPLLVQGEMPRHELLAAFREQEGSILFGTDSFWEGVDVIGDQLRAVILTKLPFKMPNDPLFQAKSEQLQAMGKQPFMSYALPQAIVKFRQGFGRLIRHQEDRGFVVCLDRRLIDKGYGKRFIQSLPSCPTVVGNRAEVLEELTRFYQQQPILALP